GTVFVDLYIDEPPRRRDLALRAAELHQQRIARELHVLQLRESGPQPLQFATTHGAFLGDSILALGEHVEFAVLGQELDLHARAGIAPGFGDEGLLETIEPSLR